MFREMTRKAKQMSPAALLPLLNDSQFGILAVLGDNGYAYAVPLNFVHDNGKIYIHGLKGGHKVDSLKANPKVSFCIVNDAVAKPAEFSFAYTSIIIFGTARQLEGEEKRAAIDRVIRKYSAEHWEKGQKVVNAMWDKFAAFEIPIDHITGKQSR